MQKYANLEKKADLAANNQLHKTNCVQYRKCSFIGNFIYLITDKVL